MKHYVLKKKLQNTSDQNNQVKKKYRNLQIPQDIDLDISDPLIKEYIEKKGIKLKNYEELQKERSERIKKYNDNMKSVEDSQLRKYLQKKGKEHLIDFNDKERGILKKIFNTLDNDGSGYIGISELEEPLISLGIAENLKEVKGILDTVDPDGSGCLEFQEFLDIIRQGGSEGGQQGQASIKDFFNDLTKGKLAGGQISTLLSFKMILSQVRRKKMLGFTSDDPLVQADAFKIIKAYQKFLNKSNYTDQKTEDN